MDAAWLLVAPAYLIGTFPSASLVAGRQGRDVTAEGSGNPGASNAYRTLGRRAGALVLAGDLAKGALAATLGLAAGHRGAAVACGLAAVLGHVAPITRGLRGGKGVATGAGMAAVLLPGPAAVLALLWLAAVRLSGAASVGSLVVALGLPVAALAVGRPSGEVAAFAACGALVVARHRDNLGRLRRGEERTLSPGARD